MSSISAPFDINPSGQLKTVLDGKVCTKNSSQLPLAANDFFLGDANNTLDYAIVNLSVISDVDSAVDGLIFQVSSDNITWYDSDVFTIAANVDKTFSFTLPRKYFRTKYINGSSDQTTFDLQTILKKTNSKPSSHRVADPIDGQDDATLQKSVVTGINDDGVFINASLTNDGNIKMALQEYGDTPSIDAFSRLRTSDPFTIFDSKQLHDKQPLFWDESIGGSGTSTHVPVDADVEMTVTANASDYIIRQTKQRFNYQPGKSQLIFMTFVAPQTSGLTKRVGLFDGTGVNFLTPNNGIFFETNNTLSWNICKNGTTTQSIDQADWNIDKMDGTGRSGITLDIDAPQILIIDYEWLGLGRVRVGFVINGLIVYCHYFNHSNDSSFSSVYMSTPNLPLRYSIETDGTNGGTLKHVCSTVMSEGGIAKTGILRVVDTGFTGIPGLAADVTYAVVGIRLKAAYKDITIIPEFMSMINEVNDDFRWSLHLNPTVGGTFTYVDKANSAIQEVIGTVTNVISADGIIASSGYASTDTQSASADLKTALKLGSKIDGTVDEWVLCVTPLSAGALIQGSLNFRELL